MSQLTYIARMKAVDAGGYTINFPDLPGCATAGGDSEEALMNAESVLRDYLASILKAGSIFPTASSMAALVEVERKEGHDGGGVWVMVALDLHEIK